MYIYIRNSIDFTRKLNFEDPDLEMISIEISKPISNPFLLTTWYRPPKSPLQLFDKFEDFWKKADFFYKEYYILGDLKCDLITSHTEPHTLKLIELLDTYQLFQLLEHPTRVTQDTKTLIDHIIKNNKENIADFGVCLISLSDHNLIFAVWKIGIRRGSPKYIDFRSFKNFNEEEFIENVKSTIWLITTSQIDVN